MNLHHRLIRNLTAGCACVLLLLSSCGQGQKPCFGAFPVCLTLLFGTAPPLHGAGGACRRPLTYRPAGTR